MSLKTYAEAAIPTPYIICGLKLKPFSLGHVLLFRRFGLCYAEQGKAANPVDLVQDFLLALVICSMTYEEFITAMDTDKFSVTSKGLFGRTVTKEVGFHKWLQDWSKQLGQLAKHDKDFVMVEKLQLFKEYLSEGMKQQLYWENNSDNETVSGAHWTQSVFVLLTGSLGYTQTEAYNAPLSKVFADCFKYLESKGGLTLMTEEEIELTGGF